MFRHGFDFSNDFVGSELDATIYNGELVATDQNSQDFLIVVDITIYSNTIRLNFKYASLIASFIVQLLDVVCDRS